MSLNPAPCTVPLPPDSQVSKLFINPIPNEMLRLIPLFGGDKRHLGLFIRKCEYIIEKFRASEDQNVYILHAITSRLTDNAAALLSEREDISTWTELKELLEQHFGDPRSEECLNIELESCKIKPGESYLDFCNRIQGIRSLLISKVNLSSDSNIKQAKIAIYNNTALNVFLYNLNENMVRVVRLKSPSTLEQALSIVLEEVNFYEQYTSRNRMGHSQSAPKQPFMANSIQPTFKLPQLTAPNQTSGYKPPLQNLAPQQKFNFGIPSNKFQLGQQQFGIRPQFGFRPQSQPQFGYRPPQFGVRPQLPSQPQFGYKPPMQQFGYRPPQNIGYKPPQFGYKPPQTQSPRFQDTDVSMKTAITKPQPQQGFRLNELMVDGSYPYYEGYYETPYDENVYCDFNEYNEAYQSHSDDWCEVDNNAENSDDVSETNDENFHISASREEKV